MSVILVVKILEGILENTNIKELFIKGSLDDYYALGHDKIIRHTEDFLRPRDLILYNDFLEQDYWFEEVGKLLSN